MAKSSVATRKASAGELARLLGLPEVNISKLKRSGVLRSTGKRENVTFQVGESIRAYIQHRRAATESEQNADFHRERAKKERAERRLREMLLEQTTGQVHTSEDIRGVQSERYGMIRSRLIGLPNALALRITGRTREEIRGIIAAYVAETVAILRPYNAQDFYNRNPKLVLALQRQLDEDEDKEADD
jgi:DNA-binding Xre family transcriptional regulator